MPTREEMDRILESLKAIDYRKTFKRLDYFRPYPKQQEFFDLTLRHREVLFMAGNQVGKTEAGAFSTACHLTGVYPSWWLGKEFHEPVTMWAAGESATVVRDVQQRKLLGPPGVDDLLGSGLIPKELIVGKPSLSRGVTDAFDTVHVRHKSGGISTLTFKSYEQGRTKFQAGTLHAVWCDEEPPADVYGEVMARITATRGIVYITFTPLKGRSEVVLKFLDEVSPDRAYVNMTLDEAEHIPAADRAKIIAGYRAHEREARAKGIPILGSGRVFEITEESITEQPITSVPAYWVKLWGIDFGIGHPFAAVLALWDRDNDVIHVHHAYRATDARSIEHADAMKRMGAAVPVSWPHDGNQRDKGSGMPLSRTYKSHGLRMLDEHAAWPDGSLSVEAGILEMQERMVSGRFKVAAQLSDWFEEFRFYHRKDGQIVKMRDDLLDATRAVIMMKRHAKAVGLGPNAQWRRPNQVADGVDFDVFG